MLAALSTIHSLVSWHPPRTAFKVSRLVPLLEDRLQVLVEYASIETKLGSLLSLHIRIIFVVLHHRDLELLLNLVPSMLIETLD